MHVLDSCVCQYEKINNKCTFIARKNIKNFKNSEKSFTSVVATAQQTTKHTKIKEFILEKIATLKLYAKRQDEI